ncbi:hypothetical protein [Microcoleus vaginatus]|uniref:hypothetical protein n=1 Tax=Microcoleus vaginatus TaxID=119532 RepID=UPI0032A6C7F8
MNRELNTLVSRAGMSLVGLIRRFLRGLWVLGLRSIACWLRQKLPKAIVVQDQELQVDRHIFKIHNSPLNSVSQITKLSEKKIV